MLRRHAWMSVHAAWLAAWLALDLLWGGLLAAGGSTAGLQQAYMLLLYPLGAIVLLVVWAGLRTLGAAKRYFAKRS